MSATSLGVSALLDELLAEGRQPGAAGEAESGGPVMDDATEEEDTSGSAECHLVGSFLPPPRGPAAEIATTPRSQQIAELCSEMDSCLASLEQWEEKAQREREDLKKELENKYGFSYEEALGADHGDMELGGAERTLGEDDESDPIGRDFNVPSNLSAVVSSEPTRDFSFPSSAGAAVMSPVSGGGGGDELDPLRQVDEARIAQLRAEVEALRQRCDSHADSPWGQEPEPECSENLPSGLDGFNSWCAEVDDVLGNPAFGEPAGPGTNALEGRLADVREQVGRTEGAINSARSRVEAELDELSQLLAECDEVQAKMGFGPQGAQPCVS